MCCNLVNELLYGDLGVKFHPETVELINKNNSNGE